MSVHRVASSSVPKITVNSKINSESAVASTLHTCLQVHCVSLKPRQSVCRVCSTNVRCSTGRVDRHHVSTNLRWGYCILYLVKSCLKPRQHAHILCLSSCATTAYRTSGIHRVFGELSNFAGDVVLGLLFRSRSQKHSNF